MKVLYEHYAYKCFLERKYLHAYHYFRMTGCRYLTALCLIHLGNFKEAEVIIDKHMEDPDLE